MKTKKKQSFAMLLDWMVEKYHLHGNDLIAYAIIYGFSQDGESEYKGSYAYLCKWLDIDRSTVIRILKRLESRGLLTKRQTMVDGKMINRWKAECPDVPSACPAGPEEAPEKIVEPHPPDPWQNATSGEVPPVAKCHSDPWQNATQTSGKVPPKYTRGKDIGKSIYLSAHGADEKDGLMEPGPDREETEMAFREQLELDTLALRYDPDELAELLASIVDMYCCTAAYQQIGQQLQSTKAIRKILDSLTSQHIEYIMESLNNTTHPIKNIRSYLQVTILRAPSTVEHYYKAQANAAVANGPHSLEVSQERLEATLRRVRKRGDSA